MTRDTRIFARFTTFAVALTGFLFALVITIPTDSGCDSGIHNCIGDFKRTGGTFQPAGNESGDRQSGEEGFINVFRPLQV